VFSAEILVLTILNKIGKGGIGNNLLTYHDNFDNPFHAIWILVSHASWILGKPEN
jgi:hypothetical protein